jgi:hypothetical protein
MRPLNKQDYLMIGIVVLTLIAGIVTLLAVALKFWEDRKELRADTPLPKGRSRLGPGRRSTPPTSTFEPDRRSTAASTLPGERL